MDNGNWVSAIVTESLEEMIQISLQNENSKWIHYDKDNTGPHLKVQSHTKNNVIFYKV